MRAGVFAGLAVLVWFAVAAGEQDGAEKTLRVHSDAKALAAATLEVTEALMRDDAPTARLGLDRMEKACRKLTPEEAATLFEGILTLDRALHTTLANSREFSGAGEVERTFDEFIWVQRTCRQCHALAREAGKLPRDGPLW